LVAFLFEWRTAVISLSAIPLSLLAATMVLYWRGYTINTMVIAGLVIALGEVVDDAIIDVENIMRRLKLNREAGNPESAFSVVLKASLEVRSSIVFATLIVVLVFLPIFFLDGLSGSFFRDLGSVAREVEAKVKALSFDRGYHPEFLGEYAARQASQNRLLALSGLALLGILLLLHADFRSLRLVLLVFFSLPFALVGGVAPTLVTGGVLSLGSLVGFVDNSQFVPDAGALFEVWETET
jgi:Cu/Ag efflux pump CusA